MPNRKRLILTLLPALLLFACNPVVSPSSSSAAPSQEADTSSSAAPSQEAATSSSATSSQEATTSSMETTSSEESSTIPEPSSSSEESIFSEETTSSDETSSEALSSLEESSSEPIVSSEEATSSEEPTPSSEPVSSSEFISSEEESSEEEPSSEAESSSVPQTSSEEEEESSFEPPVYHDGTYHFYCVNDFHGSVLERQSTYYEAGIAKYFGKLRELKEADPDHTFIFSAGDMFQGSLESNFNYGELVMSCMNDVLFDAMAVGNHEFDYGPERLKTNILRADFPILGGNIFKYENGKTTDEPWFENIKSSTIIERGGNRIGVVGMIGGGQTTSIASQYVADVDFADPVDLAKAEAISLKQKGCDIVILLVHDTYKNVVGVGNKVYFDGVFTAHTHQKEVRTINAVPFVQSYCNGEAISHFDLTIASGKVTCTGSEIINVSSTWAEDESIAAIRDSFLDEDFKTMAERPAGTVEGSLAAKIGVPNLACKAMYEKYLPQYPDLACAMTNGQRAGLSGDITYSDIVKATPFTNCVVIARVSGADIVHEAGYNLTYTGDTETYGALDDDAFYTIACTDYTICHQGLDKTYDYFPSLNPGRGGEILGIYETYPFDLTYDYCVDVLRGNIIASDFTNYAPGFHLYA